MSLDSNTTELNEILAMANNLPEAGGQDVFYVGAEFDFATLSVVSIYTTYEEIAEAVEAGKYVVARGTYALSDSPVNTMYMPLSCWVKEHNQFMFSGMVESIINGNNVLLSLTAILQEDNGTFTRAKIVSVTDLN